MNGYEGKAQAFFANARAVLSGKKEYMDLPDRQSQQPSGQNLLPAPDSSSYTSPYSRDAKANPGEPSPFRAQRLTAASDPIPLSSLSAQHIALTTPLWDVRRPGARPLHPAIRPQYGGPAQQQTPNARRASGPSQGRPSAPKPSTFNKQSHSPIPLPPYVQKMAASASKPSPLSRPPQQANSASINIPNPPSEHAPSSTVEKSEHPPPLQQATPTSTPSTVPSVQSSMQPQQAHNPTPAPPIQPKPENQAANPFAHHNPAPMNNLHTQMAMHPQRDPWSPQHAVYQGQPQTPQYHSPSPMAHQTQYPPVQSIQPHLLHSPTTYQSLPPPQASTPVMHQPQHSAVAEGYHQYQTPPPQPAGQHYLQHQYHYPDSPQPQSQPMYQHSMHDSNLDSPVESYPPPPEPFSYDYPLPPSTQQPEYGPMASEFADMSQPEDSNAFLQKMMMNLKRASGQLDTSPT